MKFYLSTFKKLQLNKLKFNKLQINILKTNLSYFHNRHIGINDYDKNEMLKKCNLNNIDSLVKKINPNISNINLLNLPKLNEEQAFSKLKNKTQKNPDKKFGNIPL